MKVYLTNGVIIEGTLEEVKEIIKEFNLPQTPITTYPSINYPSSIPVRPRDFEITC